jgi:hypothetical protein
MKPKHPPGPPMTLGNMRELGVRRLVALAEVHRDRSIHNPRPHFESDSD